MASLAAQQQQPTNPIATSTPGLYFYVNTKTTPHDTNLQRLLAAVSNTSAFAGIFYDQREYDEACRQVREAGGNTGYACGDVISPNFFDSWKMSYTINYVILIITPRDKESMGSGSSTRSRKDAPETVATHGFVVLRDLTRVDTIKAAILGQGFSPDVSLKSEQMLYIEGLCANRAAGQGAGMRMMDLVHQIAFGTEGGIYQGCKLSALVYVIQFYFRKFSYRFRNGCEGDGATTNFKAEHLRALNNMVQRLPRLPGDDDVYGHAPWVEFLKILSVSGFNAFTTKEQAARVVALRDIKKKNYAEPLARSYDEDGEMYKVHEGSRIIAALKEVHLINQIPLLSFYNGTQLIIAEYHYKISLDLITS